MHRPSAPPEDRIAALEAELERLRESERMYRFSAELGARLVWAADPAGALRSIGSPWSKVTGVTEQGAFGEGWLDIVHPDDFVRTRDAWREAVRTGGLFDATFRARIADGSYRVARSRASPIQGGDGAIRCWYGVTEDIEEEVRAEEARRGAEERLRESEEMHRYTLEMSQQIAWTTEADGSGLVMSARYEELTGHGDPEEASQSIHPDDRDQVVTAWTESVAAGRAFAVSCRLRMKDGSYRHMRVRAAPQRDRDGNILRWYGVHRGRPRAGAGRARAARRRGALSARRPGHERRRLGP